MSLMEAIYAHLPVPAQHLACSLEGYRVQRRRYGPEYDAILAEYKMRHALSDSEFAAVRDARLAAFVRHAATTTLYYRQLFSELGLVPEDIRGLNDLSALPVLSRASVQENVEAFVSDAVPAEQRLTQHTSGTTGAGLVFPTTRKAEREQWAVWWRYRQHHGITPGTWCGYFGGRSVVQPSRSQPPFWRINAAGRQVMFSAYHMAPDNLDSYIDGIRQRKLTWLHGYPSMLSLIAARVLETDARFEMPIRHVTIGAENLTAQQTRLMQSAFGVKPLQHYGMCEAAANISECKNGCLHVDEDFAAVEFLPQADGTSQIVGTNFTNPAFPLLRYDVGDLAVPVDGSCDCGLPGRTVERIDGRSEDYLVLANGARVGRLDHILKDMVNIRASQFVQEQAGVAALRIVRGNHYGPEDETLLARELASRLGTGIDIRLEYLDELPRTKSGKIRFVVSSVS